MQKKFIGFDIGAESGRCFAAILENEQVKLHEVHRFTTHNIKYDNGFHWDILAIYEELLTGLANASKNFGRDFDGIGIDTWGVDYVLIDPENRILGYPYHYRDDRTDDMMDHAFEIIPKEVLYQRTGIQFAQINTIFQLLSEKYRKFNLLTAADKMLLIPDYLNFLLSGNKKSEFSIASTTGLVNPQTRSWDRELIEMLKIPSNIFPPIIEPGTNLGNLLPHIAEKIGLSPQIPIIASACHDTASAVASVPANGKNWAFLSSGTWSLMGIESQSPVLNKKAMNYNFTNEGGVQGTTRFLKNIIGLWPIQECRRYWLEKGEEYSYPQLTALAKKTGLVNSWVDLNDQRFLKAGEMPEKILSFLKETGQEFKTDVGFIISTVLGSLAYTYRKTIEEIEDVTGKKIEILHAVGGGIQNELLTQLTADATGLKVLAGPVEGTVAGNIGVQAIATGAVAGLNEWRKIVSNSFNPVVYEPVNTEYFNKNEANFRKVSEYSNSLIQ